MLRDRLYQYLEAVEPEAESGFDLAGEVLARRRGGRRGSAEHAPPGAPVGVAVAGTFGRGTGALTGVALATADGPAAWFDPAALDEADEARGRGLAGRPEPAQGDPRRQAGAARLRARTAGSCTASAADTALAAYLARPDQRTYDLTDLALRYLHRELRVDAPETGQLTLDGLGDDGRRRAEPDAARPGHPRPGRRDRRRAVPRRRRGPRGCWPRWSCRWSRCWPRWSAPASPPTPTTCPSWRRTSRPR